MKVSTEAMECAAELIEQKLLTSADEEAVAKVVQRHMNNRDLKWRTMVNRAKQALTEHMHESG